MVRFFQSIRFAVCVLIPMLGSPANAGPTIRGQYYDEVAYYSSCPSTSSCRVDFSQTPPDKLIEVTNVACYANTTKRLSSLTLGVAASSGGPNIARQTPLNLPEPYAFNTVNNVMTTNQPIRFLVGTSRYPFILLGSLESFSIGAAYCHLVGNVLDVP
jgi:hypothetical protein